MPLEMRAGLVTLTGCDWHDCDHDDILLEEEFGVFCICHAGDDMLPELHSGVMTGCAHCGANTVWHTAEGLGLHDRCRKRWAANGRPDVWEGGAMPLHPSRPLTINGRRPPKR